MSRVTINLTDLTVTVRTELELALAEIEPLSIIDLIHECPVCQTLFWAGRADKVACNRHAERWRKGKQRRRLKQERAKAGKQAAEREHAQLKQEAIKRFSLTAIAVLNAIAIGNERVFYKIDRWVWSELKENPAVRKVAGTHTLFAGQSRC